MGRIKKLLEPSQPRQRRARSGDDTLGYRILAQRDNPYIDRSASDLSKLSISNSREKRFHWRSSRYQREQAA
jgi:hypothetical protein